MPNAFAYFMLLAWPFVAIILFRHLSTAAALTATIIGGYLFLPGSTAFDLPGLPPVDKRFVAAVSAFILCIIASAVDRRRAKRRAALGGRESIEKMRAEPKPPLLKATVFFWILVALLCLSPFLTVVGNPEPLIFGDPDHWRVEQEGLTFLKGLLFYDGISDLSRILAALLPLLIARYVLTTEKSHLILLYGFGIGALIYSFLVLFEVRMSPQLNAWIYGFFPHSFGQHMRLDGFRPIVFLEHGLWVGIFLSVSFVAAVSLWRYRRVEDKVSLWGFVAAWIFISLFVSKNVGATGLALLFLPVLLFANIRLQMIFAACVTLAFLSYPALRSAGLVPVETVYNIAHAVNEYRAESFRFRVDNETDLLARANEKPVFGWGGFARNSVYDEESGRVLSITDGEWIIVLGQYGWFGYLTRFGLICLPLLLLMLRQRQLELSFATGGLSLMLAMNLIDLVPNATLTPLTYLMAGALMGRYERLSARQAQAVIRQRHEDRAQRANTVRPATAPIHARKSNAEENIFHVHKRKPRMSPTRTR